MSDTITARGSESKFKPHTEGQFVALCVDTISLGERLQDYPGTPSYLAETCAIVFRTGERNEETGEYIDIAREFTVSMGDKANLRKFLEQWRGKPYTKEQIEQGVLLHKLTGNPALLTIAHRTSGKGRIYANITACVGVPEMMKATIKPQGDYKRADFWETRKKEYAEAAEKFRGDQSPAGEFEDYPDAQSDSDDLPF